MGGPSSRSSPPNSGRTTSKQRSCLHALAGFPDFPDPTFQNNSVQTNIPSSIDTVLDLVAAENPSAAPAEDGLAAELSRRALGDAGELLDTRAKIAYRRRLAEIEDDIGQARALGDTERTAQADVEREFLVRELSRAVTSVVAIAEPHRHKSVLESL